MELQTLGFIGFGNMAQAMARGLLRGGEAPRLFACAKRWEKLQASAGALGATPCRDAGEVLENAQVLRLAQAHHVNFRLIDDDYRVEIKL